MKLANLSFAYGENVIFDGFSLDIPDGGVLAVMGDSGVGKTTLLHLLAGLVSPETGEVPHLKCSYMFQEPRLLPTLTALKNVQIACGDVAKARQWLDSVELTQAAGLYPRQLSGGMAQRVSMARAFAFEGELLLMDEPFKGLDVALQARLQQVFLRLQRDSGITTVLVTHDVDEAVSLGDRVVVLRGKPCGVVYQSEVTPDTREQVRQAVREALLVSSETMDQ